MIKKKNSDNTHVCRSNSLVREITSSKSTMTDYSGLSCNELLAMLANRDQEVYQLKWTVQMRNNQISSLEKELGIKEKDNADLEWRLNLSKRVQAAQEKVADDLDAANKKLHEENKKLHEENKRDNI